MRVTPFIIKFTGAFAQLATTVLLVQMLSTKTLAEFYIAVAVGMTIAPYMDLNFAQYSFKFINRGIQVEKIMGRTMRIWVISLCCLILLTIIFICIPGLSTFSIFVTIIASSIGKLNYINRNVLLTSKKDNLTFLLDSAQPVSFLALCTFAFMIIPPHGTEFNGTDPVGGIVLGLYLFSFIISFLMGTFTANTQNNWVNAVRTAKTNARFIFTPDQLTSSYKLYRRYGYLAIEWNVVTLWLNIPLILSGVYGSDATTTIIGIFNRILGALRIFIALSLTLQTKYYYENLSENKVFEPILKTGALYGTVICISTAVAHQVSLCWNLNSVLSNLEIMSYLTQLSQYFFIIGLIVTLEYFFFNLSIVAMSRDFLRLRVLAPAIGLAILTISLIYAHYVLNGVDIKTAMIAYIVSLLATTSIFAGAMRQRSKPR